MASDVSSGDAPSGGRDATREPETGFERPKSESLGLRIQHVLHARPILGPLAVLLLSIIAFSIVSGRFLSGGQPRARTRPRSPSSPCWHWVRRS
jgi:hypothetical protein